MGVLSTAGSKIRHCEYISKIRLNQVKHLDDNLCMSVELKYDVCNRTQDFRLNPNETDETNTAEPHSSVAVHLFKVN